MDSYKTFKNFGSGEIIDRKSKFIGYSQAVTSEVEAAEFINRVKGENKAARHAVYAYVLDNGTVRFSDDGEPSGTGGKPILEMLTRQELVNCCVVVVRYFGGVLLGTGGLSRAYSAAAKLAADESGVAVMNPAVSLSVELDYTYSGKLKHLLKDYTYTDENIQYSEKVSLSISLLANEFSKFIKSINELTNGEAVLEENEKMFRNFDR